MRYLVMAFVLCFLGLGLGATWRDAADLTEDKIYSLSRGSLNILHRLSRPLQLTYFAPRGHPKLDQPYPFHINRVWRLLKAYEKRAKGLIALDWVDTSRPGVHEAAAKKAGLFVQEGEGYTLLWGLRLSYAGQDLVIPAFDVENQGFVEFEISERIHTLVAERRPKLRVISSQAVLGEHRDPRFKRQRDWMVMRSLRKTFHVSLHPLDEPTLPEDIDLLMVIGTDGVSPELWRVILRYVERGGPLIIAVDPFCRACDDMVEHTPGDEQSSSKKKAENAGESLNLSKLLAHWHVGYDPKLMVGDLTRATRVRAVGKVVEYPFFMRLRSQDFADSFKITNYLKEIFYVEGGFFDLSQVKSDQYEAIPLLRSGENSGVVEAAQANLKTTSELSQVLKGNHGVRDLSVLLNGRLPLYSQPDAYSEHTSVLLLADIDMLHDRNTSKKMVSNERTYLRPKNDNIAFFDNAAQLLAGDENLISIRNHENLLFQFDHIKSLRQASELQYEHELKALGRDLAKIRQQLADYNAMSHDRLQSTEVILAIDSLKEEELALSRKLADLSELAEREVISLLNLFEKAVILVPPFCFLAFVLFLKIRRRRALMRPRGGDRRKQDRRSRSPQIPA